MKTAIVYVSSHHGNTKKLLDAIAAKHDVDLIDVLADRNADISGYDRIGIASGVSFGKYYPEMLEYLQAKLPEGRQVFYIHTAGDPREKHNAAAKAVAEGRGCKSIGTYFCKGFDTYGPFKLVGGINKNHPDADETAAAVKFYEGLA